MSRWTCIARKPLVVVACALSLFASMQVLALAPAGAETLPVVSSYDVRPAAVGDHCMSGSAIDGNTSRQCNDAWNLVNAYVGGVGSFGQDCDVTFFYAGNVYLEWWNGGAYRHLQHLSYGHGLATARLWTGTRIVVEATAGRAGELLIEGIDKCSKPANGSDFLLVNVGLSQRLHHLACATPSIQAPQWTTTSLCHYTDQVRLSEVGSATDSPVYRMQLPYWQSDSIDVVSGQVQVNPCQANRRWQFLPLSGIKGSHYPGAWWILPITAATAVLTFPTAVDASPIVLKPPTTSDMSAFMLIPVPWQWHDPVMDTIR